MYLRTDGALALLTRSADLRQARLTSVIEDIRIWTDREGADPAGELRDLVGDYGGRGKRIGVEYHAYGLTAQRGKMVDAAFAGFCELVDASDLVRLLRLVKSPAELAYLREAGRLVDEACAVSQRLTVPGASVGAVYGEMMSTIMRGDGDPSASRWPMGAGEEALLVRYHTGHGTVAPRDQMQFEIAMRHAQIGKFAFGFLHPVFAKNFVTGLDRGTHIVFAFGFADGRQFDAAGIATGRWTADQVREMRK